MATPLRPRYFTFESEAAGRHGAGEERRDARKVFGLLIGQRATLDAVASAAAAAEA